MKKIYLACPYTHKDKKVRDKRVRTVSKKAAELIEQGNIVFSPLSHSERISKYCKADPCDQKFWLNQCLWIIDHCDEFHIFCIEGWRESKGIREELKRAIMGNLKLRYIKNE